MVGKSYCLHIPLVMKGVDSMVTCGIGHACDDMGTFLVLPLSDRDKALILKILLCIAPGSSRFGPSQRVCQKAFHNVSLVIQAHSPKGSIIYS